ncbi:NAD(P)-dependent oxidoreductase [Pseudomonas sp. KNUC1026]|uniref:NAD(P)-dependent oxidoreductase n=1 Tax=Pseudomonas sp. KNUC1026 TaxID=2893890 RepID=UPI001F27602F|nr:NAD(P)-dependent oxidoreductase [Pseudomonas sp. KNUC1026]UFH51553.1 NAD(P)-dependent oxidoreductase [Pseudomonas sp. KNUC1026]
MSRIALIGASGQAGSRILAELSRRGHSVTAIARHPEKIEHLPGVTAVAGDANDSAQLQPLIAGHDLVISSVHFTASKPAQLLADVRASGVPRYLVVGGAGSLLAGGKPLIESPQFPAEYLAEATAGARFLELLRQEKQLDWTFLSPSAEFFAGERTGQFRLGQDELLAGPEGSRISFEDYAVALADEIERPAHSRQRFTVGY